MTTLVAAVLQAALALLATVQSSPSLPPALLDQANKAAQEAIQLATFAQVRHQPLEKLMDNPNIWVTMHALTNADYVDADKKIIHLTNGRYTYPSSFSTGGMTVTSNENRTVELDEQYTSFGDLNGDTFDDVVVFLKETKNGGEPTYRAAGMVNENGVLYNAASISLGSLTRVYDHRTGIDRRFKLDYEPKSGSRKTVFYTLVGSRFVEQ